MDIPPTDTAEGLFSYLVVFLLMSAAFAGLVLYWLTYYYPGAGG